MIELLIVRLTFGVPLLSGIFLSIMQKKLRFRLKAVLQNILPINTCPQFSFLVLYSKKKGMPPCINHL